MPYVLMKVFEENPRQFDAWMRLLTLGRLEKIREEIASSRVSSGSNVLEIGCGPGTMAGLLAERQISVVGIDTSAEMIAVARERLNGNARSPVEFRRLSALEIDTAFREQSFDQVIAIMVLSELTDDEIDCVLQQCHRVLKPGGRLIVADEVEPRQALRRGFFRTLRYVLRLITFLVLQAKDLKRSNLFKKILYYVIELPLMLLTFLVVPAASRPVSRMDDRVRQAGFRLGVTKTFLGGTLRLLEAEKISDPAAQLASVPNGHHEEEPGAGLLKRVFQVVFRVVPYPITPRLIRLGNPARRSPVLVTTNYDLTVRRVRRALEGTDCYLLVAPAGGLDVWCAAGGGRFSIDSIVSILKTTRIAELVEHRRIILPELCANGINMFEIRRRTGWAGVFGPVQAKDLPEYLRVRRKSEAMMRVPFHVSERLEMAASMWGSLSLRYTLFPALLFGWNVALPFVLLLAVLSVGISLGCFVLPGKTFVQKAAVLAVPGFLGLAAVLALGGPGLGFLALKWTLMLGFAAFLAGTAFPSYSPLWPCGYSKLFYGASDLKLAIIEEQCIGCKICDLVCPVECFSPGANRKMLFVNPDICVGCGACVMQCPTEAIINEVAADHRVQTACG